MKKFLCLAMLASSILPLAGEETTGNFSSPRFYGYLRYDAETFTKAGGPRGLYSIDVLPEGRVTAVDLTVGGVGGACFGDGKYYVIDYTQNNQGELTSVTLRTYNPADWSVTSEIEIPQTSIPTTMTYNPADNKIYGCFFNNDTDKMEFGILDKGDGTTSVIKVLETSITALAADHKGNVYAIDANGDFLKYNPAVENFDKIGATGLKPQYIQDAAFDFGTRQLYWFAMTGDQNESGIYNVDVATGAASRLTTYVTGAKEMTGVFSMTPVYDDAVPSIVTDFSMDVTIDGTATLTFKMPSATYGDAPLSGSLGYEVLVDGVSAKSSEAQADTKVNLTLNLEDGSRVVSVRATNAAGAGPEYIARQFVGFDQPDKVKNILAVRTPEGIQVSWDAVETGVHNLPVDIDNIRYTVTRLPDETVVASGLQTPGFTDKTAAGQPALVSYIVTATDGSSTSESTQSNQVVMGDALMPPFSYDFRNKPGMGLFTSIDNNGDGASWMFRDKYGILCMYSSQSADDWLITPPIKLSQGRRYQITASIGVAMYPERFEIKYGKGAQVADMTLTAVGPTDIDDENAYYRDVWDEPGNIVAEIVPAQDGEYHFAVHAISDPDALFLYCCDFALEDKGEASVSVVSGDSDAVAVTAGADYIAVSGATGTVEVYTAAGALAASAQAPADGRLTIPVGKGFYIVNAGGHACKIMVK